MASLKELKGRINSVKSTQKITKAKQMVAAAKLRKAQASAEAARPYAKRLAEVMASLSGKGRRVTRRAYPDRVPAHFDTTEVREPGFAEATRIADELVAMYEAGRF